MKEKEKLFKMTCEAMGGKYEEEGLKGGRL